MQADSAVTHAIAKSVLVVACVFVIICAGWGIAVYSFDFTPPTSAGSATTLISTLTGGYWFRWKLDRLMTKRERLGFAAGVTLLNVVIPVVYIGVLLMFAGLPLSPASYDLVLAGGKGYLFEPAIAWLMIFILALVFVQAYFFGWLSTKERRKPSISE